ncbi:lysozyme [Roseburia hominis]|uniref:lysozyme n=1 Tax=Roseburia hominis TaxID=301301 RepID=UPI001F2A030E|nr:lysozyme [Roseburia hominis]
MSRTIGQAGLALIKRFEGYRLAAYQCAAGVWTIGYGHTSGVKKGQTITQAQAEEYLRQDLRKFENYVNNPAYVPQTAQLNQNQFDTLVSFAFNCGQGNLKTLCSGGRTLAQIAAAMPKYCKAAGKTLQGLVKRRAEEVALFNTPVASQPTIQAAEAQQHVQPNYQPGQAYFVHVDNLRIRSKPSTNGTIVGKISNRAVLNKATTRDSKGAIWMNISGTNKPEWVCADTGIKSFVY